MVDFGFELEACIKDAFEDNMMQERMEKFIHRLEMEDYECVDDSSIRKRMRDKSIEIRSPAFEFEDHKDFCNEIFEHAKMNHVKLTCNNSCGFHVHVKFKTQEEYLKLCNTAFLEYFENEYKKCFKERADRLRRGNKFCKPMSDWMRDQSMSAWVHTCDRYTALNYSAYLKESKTFEFRIFRAKADPRHLIRCLAFVDRIVREHLEKAKPVRYEENFELNAWKMRKKTEMKQYDIKDVQECEALDVYEAEPGQEMKEGERRIEDLKLGVPVYEPGSTNEALRRAIEECDRNTPPRINSHPTYVETAAVQEETTSTSCEHTWGRPDTVFTRALTEGRD